MPDTAPHPGHCSSGHRLGQTLRHPRSRLAGRGLRRQYPAIRSGYIPDPAGRRFYSSRWLRFRERRPSRAHPGGFGPLERLLLRPSRHSCAGPRADRVPGWSDERGTVGGRSRGRWDLGGYRTDGRRICSRSGIRIRSRPGGSIGLEPCCGFRLGAVLSRDGPPLASSPVHFERSPLVAQHWWAKAPFTASAVPSVRRPRKKNGAWRLVETGHYRRRAVTRTGP